MTYDVVIIGAGPAGSHLCNLLTKHDLNVALVDRLSFPRDKLCGGLLTQKTLDLLNTFYPSKVFSGYGIKSAHIFYMDELIFSLNLLSMACTVRRNIFDTDLVKISKKQGASTYFGKALISIDFLKNEVHLQDGSVLKYVQLVGADGAFSRVRYLSGVPRNQLGFCAETHIPWNQIKYPRRLNEGGIEIYYGNYSKGYGWIFPNYSSVIVGVGNMVNEMREKEIVSLFKEFLHNVSHSSDIKFSGAYIPSGTSVALGNPVYKNVCLIGDAAGLIDPFTGEGIYYALISAEIAAKAILTGKLSLPQYMSNMQSILDTIKDNTDMRNQIYTPTILKNSLATMQSMPKYSEQMIDETIVRYSKTYREAYEEFQYYSR